MTTPTKTGLRVTQDVLDALYSSADRGGPEIALASVLGVAETVLAAAPHVSYAVVDWEGDEDGPCLALTGVYLDADENPVEVDADAVADVCASWAWNLGEDNQRHWRQYVAGFGPAGEDRGLLELERALTIRL